MAKKQDGTFLQRRIRELGWALYVSEGYAANLRNIVVANAYTMSNRELAPIKKALGVAEEVCTDLRAEIAREVRLT